MRLAITLLLLTLSLPITETSFADDKSDCLNSCASDKRANDMYCPPAGGFTDEENKQCTAKNTTDYNNCKNSCAPPTDQQSPPIQSPQNPLEDPAGNSEK